MKVNVSPVRAPKLTHEGAVAAQINPPQELRRSVMACMLWEDQFYESGLEISKRISENVGRCKPLQVRDLAVEARRKFKLRHIPLFLVNEMLKYPEHRPFVGSALAQVVQRPDEMGEFLAIYFKEEGSTKRNNGKGRAVPAQVKKGIAAAFTQFNEYELAKWDQSSAAVKLRDVMFLCHPKPENKKQEELFKRLANGELKVPDTWEIELSSSKDKKLSWERLLKEKRLGALALLRNLRNMHECGVSDATVKRVLAEMRTDIVLPFRFISAARHAPWVEGDIEQAMFRSLTEVEKLPGRTAIVVDNSGSMYGKKVSSKSDIDRSDAACALAILVREICEDTVVVGFGNEAAVIPARRGFALADAIKKGPGGGTYTQAALDLAAREGYSRIIVITDEQSHERISSPVEGSHGYFINVASYQNGIGYGDWTHIDGFSEAVLSYIRESEVQEGQPWLW